MTRFDRFADWVAERWSSAPWFTLCAAGVATWAVAGVRTGFGNETWHLWLNSPTTALTFLGVFLLHNTTHRFERQVLDRLARIEQALGLEPWPERRRSTMTRRRRRTWRKVRDALERLFWTFSAAFLGSLLGAPVLLAVTEAVSDVSIDVNALEMALVAATMAGLTAVANAVLILARWRLAVLPNPGEGLPALPTNGG